MTHPAAHLLTDTGSYNVAAIMREAHANARKMLNLTGFPCMAKLTYAQHFVRQLRNAWERATAARCALQVKPVDPASALFAAQMIDDTRRSYAAQGAPRSIWDHLPVSHA